VWFTAASAACAFAPDIGVLVATRALQGAGAALLSPGSLAIIEATFDPQDRGPAIGAWSGLGGVATAAGPLLGGWLIAAASWRWIFVINLPLGVAVLVVSARHVPESKDATASGKMDWRGAALAVCALAALTYGLVDGESAGWASATVLASLVGGAALLAAFLASQRWSRAPMLPLAVFKVRRFSITNAATFFIYAALGGTLFLLPVELQVVDRYSPLDSGVALLPMTVVMLLLSARSGRLAARIGPWLQMSFGPLLVAGGVLLLWRTTSDATYGTGVLPGVLVIALGLAATVAPLTATALGALPDNQAGVASAVNNDVARLGGLIAVAVLPAVGGISGQVYNDPHRFAAGFKSAVVVAAAWCVFAALLSLVGLRTAGRTRRSSDVPVHCALDATPMAGDRQQQSA
jgi:EmrB/QacA subfamily drug resistance transporter